MLSSVIGAANGVCISDVNVDRFRRGLASASAIAQPIIEPAALDELKPVFHFASSSDS
jgi:hypothetical protein